MTVFAPEIEIVDHSGGSLRYLEHGWPTPLCRWHAHREYELHLVLETTGWALIGDNIDRFAPGQLFLTGPMLPHNWVTDDDGIDPVPLRDMLVQFDHATIVDAGEAFPEVRQLLPMLDLAANGMVFTGFDPGEAREGLAEIRGATGVGRLAGFLALMDRLAKWPNKRSLSGMRLAPAWRGDAGDRIGRVVDHVTANFADELSAAGMAELADMSPKAFSSRFQQQTGNRFTDFVNRIRVCQTCVLLSETQKGVAEICREVGFNNIANFNRNFRRIMGTSPSEFRRSGNKPGADFEHFPMRASGSAA